MNFNSVGRIRKTSTLVTPLIWARLQHHKAGIEDQAEISMSPLESRAENHNSINERGSAVAVFKINGNKSRATEVSRYRVRQICDHENWAPDSVIPKVKDFD